MAAGDFTELSLEELDALSISAASKRSQPLFETPAAVSVLLPVDIRRSGHGSVAEALRLIPGVHVTHQLSNRWGIGVRGGNGVQSTKLLVLVDGRSVYGSFNGSVDWNGADTPLDDLARVEVVRGPGATLWGANAVNGIINVISKNARDTQGSVLAVRGGSGEAAQARLRHGGQVGNNTWFRVYAGGNSSALAPGAFADDPLNAFESAYFGTRADSVLNEHFELTTQADHRRNTRTLNGAASTNLTSSVLTRLTAHEIAGGDFKLQLYYDNSHSRAASTDQLNQGALPSSLNEDTSNLDLDLSHHVHLGSRHDFIWGGGARLTTNSIESTPTLFVAEPRRETVLFNVFIQDEIALTPKTFRLTLGTKFEHHSTIGWQALPNLRLAWLPTPQHTFWAASSRAVRAPSRGEREVLITLARIPAADPFPGVRVEIAGDPQFDAEVNNAHELGWRWRPSPRFQTDLTAYYFDYDHVRNLRSEFVFEPGPPSTIVSRHTITNDADADAHGIEASAQWRVSDRWELHAVISRGEAHARGDFSNPFVAADYAIPDWIWHLRSWWQLPRDFDFSTALYGVGENEITATASYLRLDAQLAWHPRPDVELALGIQNAGDPRHDENIATGLTPSTEVRRNVYARIQWRF